MASPGFTIFPLCRVPARYSDRPGVSEPGTRTLPIGRTRILGRSRSVALGYSDAPDRSHSGTRTLPIGRTRVLGPSRCVEPGTRSLPVVGRTRILGASCRVPEAHPDPRGESHPGTRSFPRRVSGGIRILLLRVSGGPRILPVRRARVLRPSRRVALGYSDPPGASRSGTPTLPVCRARVLRPSWCVALGYSDPPGVPSPGTPTLLVRRARVLRPSSRGAAGYSGPPHGFGAPARSRRPGGRFGRFLAPSGQPAGPGEARG